MELLPILKDTLQSAQAQYDLPGTGWTGSCTNKRRHKQRAADGNIAINFPELEGLLPACFSIAVLNTCWQCWLLQKARGSQRVPAVCCLELCPCCLMLAHGHAYLTLHPSCAEQVALNF